MGTSIELFMCQWAKVEGRLDSSVSLLRVLL